MAKLLILTASKDTLSWPSLPNKLAEIKLALNSGKNADWLVDIQYKSAQPIVKDERISHDWLESHFKDFYQDYDIVAFHYSYKQKAAWGVQPSLRGANPNRKDTYSDLYFWSDEDTKRKGLSQFVETCLHEIAHEVFQQSKTKDITHEYHDSHDSITGLYKTFDWSKFKPRISALKKQKKGLKGQILALVARLAKKAKTGTKPQVPKLPVPFLSITQAYGTENWSLYPSTGRHWGLDLRAKEGTVVSAPLDGEVIESKYTESLGYYLQFFDGKDYHIIPHLKGLARLDKYKQGEKMQEIGKTGKIVGVHCHLEIWIERMVNRVEQLKNRGLQITKDPAVYYSLK